MVTYPPEMLPKADEPAEVVVCSGSCDVTPPCPMCTIIKPQTLADAVKEMNRQPVSGY